MSSRIALCIDEATCMNPELMGLDGEALENQSWLTVFSSAEYAREAIAQDSGIDEVWVASSDGIAPINLAASLKSDRPELPVRLVAADAGGSLLSRAHTALIDEVIAPSVFVRRYSEAKRDRGTTAFQKERVLSVPAVASSLSAAVPTASASATAPAAMPAVPSVIVPIAESSVRPAPRTALAVAEPSMYPSACAVPAAVSSTFLMPVVSGSGGAGKTTVSVLSALMARDAGFRTLLFDCDLQFGDASLALGKDDALTLDDALARPDAFERLCMGDGFALIAAPRRLESAEYLAREVPRLLGTAAGHFDAIIANTGAFWSECHAVLLERASAALFLIDQRSSSLRACKHALELCTRCGIATGPFRFVLNRCAKGALFNVIDVSCALQGQQVLELKDGGRDVEEYLGAGAAEELIGQKNDLCVSLQHLLEQVLPASPGAGLPAVSADKAQQGRKQSKRLLRRSRGAR